VAREIGKNAQSIFHASGYSPQLREYLDEVNESLQKAMKKKVERKAHELQHLSKDLIFPQFCRHMAKMAMPSSSSVKHFNVIKPICFGFNSGCVHFSLYTFSLERVEKTFCHRIIETRPSSAHTLSQMMRFQEVSIITARILASLSAVNHYLCCFGSLPYCHEQRFNHNVRCHSTALSNQSLCVSTSPRRQADTTIPHKS
jgi:hypothetical protein